MSHNNRGNAWRNKKEYDKAIADYTEAIRLDPKFVIAYYNRGVAWRKKKECDKAIADYTEAIRLDPKYAAPHNSIAWLKATAVDAKYRDGKLAIELATKALELAGPNPTWHYHGILAAAYAEAGEFDKAVAEQKKALEGKDLDKDKRAKMEKRLELYKAKKPYRDE